MTDTPLTEEAIADAIGDRPVRLYPAMLSTEADATAWARAGAPSGATVVAEHQASPRGRGGLPWVVRPGRDLGCSVVLRPELPPEREGWPYLLGLLAIAEVLGDDARVAWPDEVRIDGKRRGAVGVQTDAASHELTWAVVNLLIVEPPRPRAVTLAQVTDRLELLGAADDAIVLRRLRERCDTLQRRVVARLAPLGPDATEISGTAVDLKADGALLIETAEHRRVGVLPQAVGTIELSAD